MLKLDKKDGIVRNLGKKYKLVPHLEKAIGEFDEEWPFVYKVKELDHAWHPSGDCMLTPAQLFLIATVEPDELRPVSASLRKSFQVGHFWHQWLQYIVLNKLGFCQPEDVEKEAYKSWGDTEYARVGITEAGLSAVDWHPAPYHWVRGSADIATLTTPTWTGGVDFKTMSAQQFKQEGVPAWAADKYECQVNIYMELFDKDEWIILAIDKDSPHEFKEFLYKRNQDLIDHIMAKWQFVSDAIDAGLEITEEEDPAWEMTHLLTGPIAS